MQKQKSIIILLFQIEIPYIEFTFILYTGTDMKFILVMLAFLISTPAAHSQGDALLKTDASGDPSKLTMLGIPKELSGKTSEFFTNLVNGNINLAYKEILKGSPISEKKEEITTLIKETKLSVKLYGNIKDFEFVSSENVTSSYLRLRYLVLLEKLPMRWIFTFYKSPANGWVVTNVKFDDLSEFYFSDQ